MMSLATAGKQRGLSFVQLMLWSVVIVIAAIGLMKVVPAYVENRTIAGILNKVAHDPDMQGATPVDIRTSIDKGLSINNINTMTSNDVVIAAVPGGVVLSVKYKVKIELVGNISLLLEFDTTSARPK